MGFETKRKTLKITIEDQTVTVKAPSLAQYEELHDTLQGKEGSEVTKIYMNFLNSVGIPQEMVKELDQEGFLAVIQYMQNPTEKKS